MEEVEDFNLASMRYDHPWKCLQINHPTEIPDLYFKILDGSLFTLNRIQF